MVYTMDNNVSVTMNVNEIVFSKPTYTKNGFAFYDGCSIFNVDK